MVLLASGETEKQKSTAAHEEPAEGSSWKNNSDTANNSFGKKQIIALCLIAALILSIPLFSFSWHLVGNRRMKNGDYVGAVSAYRHDRLFSGNDLTEAALLVGEDCFKKADYSSAQEYFLLAGEAGAKRRCDALCEQAKQLTNDGKPEEAIELLEEYLDDPQAKEQAGLAWLAIAERKLKKGAVDEAIQTAEGVEAIGTVDPVPLLNRAYSAKAKLLIQDRCYLEAARTYDKCKGDERAQTDATILRAIHEKNLFAAAEQAVAARESGKTNLTREAWTDAICQNLGAIRDADVEKRLTKGALRAILRREMLRSPDTWRAAIKAALPVQKNMVGPFYSYLADESELDFYTECGNDPKGKILFVMITHDYPSRDETQVVLYDLMDLLPAEYYPRSLDEVEYLGVLSYDYSHDGDYEYVTEALRENGRMEMFRLPKKSRVYYSNTIYGDHSPSSFMYTGYPPSWYSGGAPEMSEKVYDALMSVMK